MKAVVVEAGEGVGPACVAALRAAGVAVAVDTAVPAAAGVTILPRHGRPPKEFLDACEAALGGLDFLIISARPVVNEPLMQITAETFREVVDYDLLQPALLMQDAARRMAQQSFGRIVAFSSMSAKTGAHRNVAPFAAAKGGLLAYVRAMASELAEHGVTVNAIATALFEPQVAAMTEERRATLRLGIPVGRFGLVEEAAHAMLFLLSEQAGFVTGECLNLSGGRFMD